MRANITTHVNGEESKEDVSQSVLRLRIDPQIDIAVSTKRVDHSSRRIHEDAKHYSRVGEHGQEKSEH